MPPKPSIQNDLLGGKHLHDPVPSGDELPIHVKIESAYRLFNRIEQELRSDKEFSRLLKDYERSIELSQRIMRELKLDRDCAFCATQVPGGGCCGRGIEDWYDIYTLLLNLFLGTAIPTKRLDPNDCLFLGPSGCKLRARFHFCVNYLCPRITKRLNPQELLELTTQSGAELFLAWRLESILRIKTDTSTLKTCLE